MHVFEHLPISTLKKIIREYNLHVSIKGYSKMTHSQLCDVMKKHLHIDENGSIKMMMKDIKELGKVSDYEKKPREKKEKMKKEVLKPVEEKKVEKVKEIVKEIEKKKQGVIFGANDMTPKELLKAYFLLLNCRSMQAGSQTKYNKINADHDKIELEKLMTKFNFKNVFDLKPDILREMKKPHSIKDWGISTYMNLDQEYKCFKKSFKAFHDYLINLHEPSVKKEDEKKNKK